jgi:hypothetical protein
MRTGIEKMLNIQTKTLSGRPSPSSFDLFAVYENLRDEAETTDVMRSSDHLAIRKTAAAVVRISDALITQLSSYGALGQRTLPEIKPTTRVRRTPQRFWLEFKFAGFDDKWSECQVLFAEIRKSSVTLGMRLPTSNPQGSAFVKQERKSLRSYNKQDNQCNSDWHLAHLSAPAEQSECSRDLNSWLGQRFEAQASAPNPLVICRKISEKRPSFEDLASGLADAAVQFCPLISSIPSKTFPPIQ